MSARKLAFRDVQHKALFVLYVAALFLFFPDSGKAVPMQNFHKKPAVVLMHNPGIQYWGGMEAHIVNYYKTLIANSHAAILVTRHGSETARQLNLMGLPYRTFSKEGLYHDMLSACKDINADAVVCINTAQLNAARQVARILPIKIIFEQHMMDYAQQLPRGDMKVLKGIDAIVATNPLLVSDFKKANAGHFLKIGHIAFISPFMDDDRFLLPLPTLSRNQYFKAQYNIDLKSCPVVCMIGGMYPDVKGKNYPLLFQAIKHFVHIKKTPVQAIIVGDGVKRDYLMQLAKKLGVNQYIHFLGFRPPQEIPAILHYSDFNVLASTHESFGLVHVEAFLAKRPSIGALGTGATLIIKHGLNGFLFKNDNLDDLVKYMKLLAFDPALRTKLGNAGYTHAQNNFSNQYRYALLVDLFKQMGIYT